MGWCKKIRKLIPTNFHAILRQIWFDFFLGGGWVKKSGNYFRPIFSPFQLIWNKFFFFLHFDKKIILVGSIVAGIPSFRFLVSPEDTIPGGRPVEGRAIIKLTQPNLSWCHAELGNNTWHRLLSYLGSVALFGRVWYLSHNLLLGKSGFRKMKKHAILRIQQIWELVLFSHWSFSTN